MSREFSKAAVACRGSLSFIAGQTLCWLWMGILNQRLAVMPEPSAALGVAGPAAGADVQSILVLLALVAGVAFWRKVTRLFASASFKVAVIAAMTVSGCAVLSLNLFPLVNGDAAHWARGIALATVNVVAMLQGMGVSFVLARRDWHTVFYATVVPSVCGSLLSLAILHAPIVVLAVLVLVLPTAAVLLVCPGREPFSTEGERTWAQSPTPPRRYCVTALSMGVAAGIAFGTVLEEAGVAAVGVVDALGMVAGSVLLVVLVFSLGFDYNQLLYRCAFPLLGLGFALLVALPGIPYLGAGLYLVAYYVGNIIMNCLNIYFVKEHTVSPVYIVGIATASLQAGKSLGSLVGSSATLASGVASASASLACIMAFALPVVALFSLSSENMASGWGAFKLGHATPAPRRDLALKAISVDAELSAREADVLELLARGWSRHRIAEELVVSDETVKSHTIHVYRKLGVHTKQELIDLIDAKAEAM